MNIAEEVILTVDAVIDECTLERDACIAQREKSHGQFGETKAPAGLFLTPLKRRLYLEEMLYRRGTVPACTVVWLIAGVHVERYDNVGKLVEWVVEGSRSC